MYAPAREEAGNGRILETATEHVHSVNRKRDEKLDNKEDLQLNCFYVNARSMVKKMDLMQVYAETHKLDIILVTETWFNSSISKAETELEGFNCYRCDRTNKIGGGVAIYDICEE